MIKIETKKLHWVSRRYGNSVYFYLANTDNQPLGCPTLQKLTSKEEMLLKAAGVELEVDSCNDLYTNCLPPKSELLVTAPLYCEMHDGNSIEYLPANGLYTESWMNPMEYQRINNIIDTIIPKEKIIYPGCYVNLGVKSFILEAT